MFLSSVKRSSLVLFALLVSAGLATGSDLNPPLVNWSAPATYTPVRTRSGVHTMGEIGGGPFAFFPTTPCRQYDSRNSSPLPNAANRTVTLSGAPCLIPSTALAISVNISVFNITGAGGAGGVFKVDVVSPPTIAWIIYPPTETNRSNAGVVATNGSGQIVVQVAQGAGSVDFVVDVNGYYYNGVNDFMPAGKYFAIRGSLAGGGVLYGENDNTSATNAWGVEAHTISTGTGSAGVRGTANSSSGPTFGVSGQSFSTNTGAAGVWGSSTGGSLGLASIGVYGTSTNYNGVFATATNWDALAAFGGRDGGYLQGGRHGVIGISTSPFTTTYGVIGSGVSTTSQSAGVEGLTNQPLANAGRFENTALEIRTFLDTQAAGINYSVESNGAISGSALFISGAPKNFVAPHPLDPSKEIRYASVEAPTVDVYFRGTGTLRNGYARIDVPDHFRFTAREGTYMTTLTPVGNAISLSVESEGSDGIVVHGSGNARFHYVVYAERAEIEGYEPVQPNVHFTPEALEKVQLLKALPPSTRALLVKNRTLNPDGSYNTDTARTMGWVVPETAASESIAPR